MNSLKHYFILFLLVVTPIQLLGNKIDNGFKALQIYDYFKAKSNFEKSVKSKPSVASFGLAIIYYRNDNPFHSLDSAYRYIQLAKNEFPNTKPQSILRYTIYGFSEQAIDSLRQLISTKFYQLALNENTVQGFQNFISTNSWAVEVPQAMDKRDSLAFERAKATHTSMAYADFITNYPASKLVDTARDGLMKSQYEETTKSGKLESYVLFLNAYPDNTYSVEAEDKVYELETKENTIASLEHFLRTYPTNHNENIAWERLYQLSVFDYNAENIAEFAKKYPEYPNLEKLQIDLNLIGYQLYPTERNGKFGFIDTAGVVVISPVYSSVNSFHEGMALVSKDGKFGYINKKGEIVVPLQFTGGLDFEQGRAIVEKSERFGMIDRTGMVIIEPEFEDLGVISDDLIYGLKDSLYGYYNTSGKQVIAERFSEAFSFNNGLAKVEEKGLQAYIDVRGKYVVHPAFEEIEFFTDSLLVFGNGESYGLMKRTCEIVVPNKYDEIGVLSDGLAIVVSEDYLGYINARGEEIIEPIFDLIPNYLDRSQFRDGAAVVSKNDLFGIINTKGKEIIPFKYDELGSWGELISAKKKGKWGYINRANVMVINPIYDFAETFVGNVALVQELSLFGAISKNGDKIIETAYNNIEIVKNGYLIVNNGALYGIVNSKGATIVPMIYQSIRVFDENTLILTNTEGISYFDCGTGEILKTRINE